MWFLTHPVWESNCYLEFHSWAPLHPIRGNELETMWQRGLLHTAPQDFLGVLARVPQNLNAKGSTVQVRAPASAFPTLKVITLKTDPLRGFVFNFGHIQQHVGS